MAHKANVLAYNKTKAERKATERGTKTLYSE